MKNRTDDHPTKEAQLVDLEWIRHSVRERGVTMNLLYRSVIDSTNSEAERLLASGQKGPLTVISSCQTKGRGRLGRRWHSADGDNLYLSVLFEPGIPAATFQHFTLRAGIHICRALQKMVPNASLKIKWPNDLCANERKFAGILTETKMDTDRLQSIISGIGLNINSHPDNYPKAIRQTATSLSAVHGERLSLNQTAVAVIVAIQTAYDICVTGNHPESIIEAWSPLSALCGKSVTAIANGREISGVADGIDASGALLLRQPDGTLIPIRAGNVTLKKSLPENYALS